MYLNNRSKYSGFFFLVTFTFKKKGVDGIASVHFASATLLTRTSQVHNKNPTNPPMTTKSWAVQMIVKAVDRQMQWICVCVYISDNAADLLLFHNAMVVIPSNAKCWVMRVMKHFRNFVCMCTGWRLTEANHWIKLIWFRPRRHHHWMVKGN